ncbi:ribonuclease R [Granulicatella balaenopterae]|uniref:ribonuclease R n=1 Tax=Granulicatella balaenopterae TaxID=137733 RepID=UPI000B7EAE15
MNQQIIEKVKNFFKEHEKEQFFVKEVSEALKMEHSSDFKELVKALAHLEERGHLMLTSKGKFGLKEEKDIVEGIFRANERGFGFVTVTEGEPDLFVPRGNTKNAMDGDKVVVKIQQQVRNIPDKSAEAKVMKVLERKLSQVVGVYTRYSSEFAEKNGIIGEIALKDKKLSNFTCVVGENGLNPVDGTIVIAEICDYRYQGKDNQLKTVIKKEIGYKDEVGMDILTILLQMGIPTEFSEEVMREANAVSEVITEKEKEDRVDLTKLPTITIDGADAKDLDDAISLEKKADGTYRLGVHIADVSHYVTEHSEIDQEAYTRATSVYLTDRVVPMLPQRLSNGICSLNPHEERLTMTCMMDIDQSGTVFHHEIYPSLIISDHRLTYDEVNEVYAREEATTQKYQDINQMLWDMKDLHDILARRRHARGAIDFDSKEAKILVDEEGKPTEIILRERGISERLIESFMLSANETVARHFEQLKLPFIYRIHEQPDSERMQRFLEFITAFGVVITGTNDTISPKKLQKALEEVKGETYEAVVSTMMLRSMKQAKYDVVPTGHYGLAAEDYTHFTSPIRRYPDLIVHRMIRYYHQHGTKLSHEEEIGLEAKLQDIAEQSSKMERLAVTAERAVDEMKKAEFMVEKVGQTFDAVVSSVTKFGIFVELPNTVEGLIHISQMQSDYFVFIESQLVLMGERTGQSYRIGDKVRVKLVKVDIDAREIDFLLEADVEAIEGLSQVSNSVNRRHKRPVKSQERRKVSSQSKTHKKVVRDDKKEGRKKDTKPKRKYKAKDKKKKKLKTKDRKNKGKRSFTIRNV